MLLLFSKEKVNKSRIENVLQMVGLSDWATTFLASFLAEMQRVAVGRALISDSKILLAR